MKSLHKGCTQLLCLLAVLLLGGCGSDGAQGPTGDPGPQGEPGTSVDPDYPDPTALTAQFTAAEVNNGVLTAHFKISDQDGHPYNKLSGYRFTVAQLNPGQNGNASHWQSYVNRIEAAGEVGPGEQDKIQATSENDGELTNHGDGSYSYTFSHNLAAVETPVAVTYDATLTHRIALQISGSDQPVANAIYDWQPSTGATDNIFSRNMVTTQTCNNCHGELAIHGGGRKEVQYCVTCHNPGSSDANSGNSIDFAQMIHKIHRGAELPSVEAGGEYAIYGYRNSKHDYSDVHFPQDIRNCTNCHNQENPLTADAHQWYTTPTIEACGSCHDDVNFALGKEGGHPGGIATDNSECTVCHAEGKFVGSAKQSHVIPQQLAMANFGFEILEVNNTDSGQFPQVRFRITNPQAGDNYDIANHPAFTAGGGTSRLAVDLAWGDGRDYTNKGGNSGVASAVSINALGNPQDNGDGSFTVTSQTAVPEDAVGTLAVALEGHPAGDFDGDGTYSDRIPVPGVVEFFSINGAQVEPRREVVAIDKCNACHQDLSLHGNNRTNNVQLCAMCHNPNNTDLTRRPDDPTHTTDGLTEASVDLKYMIHAIHAADKRTTPAVFYGFGSREHDYSHVRFPGKLNNCLTCHNEGTYELPLDEKVLATTVNSGNERTNPLDDLNITATAAVCSACHDTPLAKAHMEQNGGASFATSQQAIDNYQVVETCQFCHGPGQEAGVKKVHGIK